MEQNPDNDAIEERNREILADIYRIHPDWRAGMLAMYGAPSPEEQYWRERLAIEQIMATPMKRIRDEDLPDSSSPS